MHFSGDIEFASLECSTCPSHYLCIKNQTEKERNVYLCHRYQLIVMPIRGKTLVKRQFQGQTKTVLSVHVYK